MVYPYRLILTDGIYEFATSDYGRTISYKLYDQTETAFDASSYTGYIKIYDESTSGEIITEIPSNANASGVGSFTLTKTNNFASDGIYIIEWQGEKTGNIISFRCLTPIVVYLSPTGTRTP